MFAKHRMLIAVLGIVAMALVLACAAGEEEEATPVSGETPGATATKVVLPTATPEVGEVIPGAILRRYTTNDPPHWDPNMGPGAECHNMMNMVSAFLVNMRYGPDYPQWDFTLTTDGLAEGWEISDDGLIYTFHLRKGVKWQNKPPLNGRELVAEDVKWSIQNIIDTPGSPRGQPLSAIERMECPDKYTLVCYLSEPRASLLILMANPYVEVLARDVKEYFGDFNSSDAVIGAGPFMLKEYTPNVRIVWEKNPDYYRADEGLPYLDAVNISVIADASTTLAAFRAENIDIRGISRLDLDSVRGTNPNMYCFESETSATHPAMTMRTDKPPFNDVRVRQAVSMALDRQAVIDAFYLGYGIEQQGPIHASSPWYLEDQGECAKYGVYNPEEAKKLLAEAGYPDGFETTLNTTAAWGSTWMEYAEFWVDSLKKIGINATIKPTDLAGHYVNRVCKFDGLSWTYVWGGATIDPDVWLNVMYLPGGYVNYSCVDDPRLSELLIAQQTALTPEARQEALDEIQRIMACERWQIHWPHAYGVTCMQPWVHNYKAHAASMSYGRYHEIIWVDETSPARK